MAPRYSELINQLDKNRLLKDELMSTHTTFKIGGPADLYFEAKTEKDLLSSIELCRKFKIPYFVFGAGSKILVSDSGFRGLAIKISNKQYAIRDTQIVAGAGVSLKMLVEESAKNGLSGLEFAAGIPGSLGGAIAGNAGAWQQSISDKVNRVKILTANSQVKWFDQKDCQFSYRQSRFKTSGEIVLEAELVLAKENPAKIKQAIKANLEKRLNQPKEPSVGSIFVNPKPQAAGELIEKCGLKGKVIGRAKISEKHANFFINLGGAKAQDVLQLIKLAKNEVKKKFNVNLEEEVRLIGF